MMKNQRNHLKYSERGYCANSKDSCSFYDGSTRCSFDSVFKNVGSISKGISLVVDCGEEQKIDSNQHDQKFFRKGRLLLVHHDRRGGGDTDIL